MSLSGCPSTEMLADKLRRTGLIVGALLPKPVQQVECSFPGVVAETFQSVSYPISVFCSCLNLENYTYAIPVLNI